MRASTASTATGSATLEPGDEIIAEVQVCEGHGASPEPVADLIEPAR